MYWWALETPQKVVLLLLMYWWALETPQKVVLHELDVGEKTLIDRYNFLRDICGEFLDSHQIQLGGINDDAPLLSWRSTSPNTSTGSTTGDGGAKGIGFSVPLSANLARVMASAFSLTESQASVTKILSLLQSYSM